MKTQGWQVAVAIGCLLMGWEKGAIAQLIPDTAPNRTLGTTIVPLTPQVDGIGGGVQRGQNIFHSFQEFSVGANRGVVFGAPVAIRNILTRVTGGNPSQILGALGVFQTLPNGQFLPVLSNANLFLINPNGIIFGENASLSVGGSFVATTANTVQFGNQGFFSATTPNIPSSLLTINPSAFLFSQIANQRIEVNKASLSVPAGQDLALLGGNVLINSSTLQAPGGRIVLGGLTCSGTFDFSTFGFTGQRANVSLSNGTFLDVRGSNGGSIFVSGRDIDIASGSVVAAGITANSGQSNSQAGNILLNATGTVTIRGASTKVNNEVGENATGNSASIFNAAANNQLFGSIGIAGQFLSVADGAQVSASTFGNGSAGIVGMIISDGVLIDNANIFSQVTSTGVGDAGGIVLQAKSLTMSNGASLNASTFGQGKAGLVGLIVGDAISLRNSSIFSTVESGAVGDSFGLSINTGSLSLLDGAQLQTLVRGASGNLPAGRGNAGAIAIDTRDFVTLAGENQSTGLSSLITSQTQNGTTGKSGDITVKTGLLSIADGGQIVTSTFGLGKGGNLTVNSSESIKLIGTSANGQTRSALASETQGSGDAGDLTINTRNLSIRDGGTISASTFALMNGGKGGNLTVNASELIELIGTSANGKFESAMGAETTGTGDAGNLTVNTRSLIIRGGGIVSTSTGALQNGGKAGNLTVNASDSIDLIGTTTATSLSTEFRSAIVSIVGQGAQGQGGNLTLNTQRLSVRDGAGISVGTFGRGNAGTLNINATDSVKVTGYSVFGEASELSASVNATATGRGGDLTIETGMLTANNRGMITVSSQGVGQGGNLRITARSIELDSQGKLIAETASGQGGNITLNVQDLLLLRRGGTISATAGTAGSGGDGGNVAINAKFVVAIPKENSDISANAFSGSGGKVTITSQGIFGLQFRPQPTPFSDITVSSQFGFNGSVTLNSPDTSNLQNSLTEFPQTFTDTTQLLANSCIVRSRKQNGKFFITGSGGLPVRPGDAPLSPFPTGEVRSVRGERDEGRGMRDEGREETYVIQNSAPGTQDLPDRPWKIGDPIVEPQGVYKLANGDLVMSRECP